MPTDDYTIIPSTGKLKLKGVKDSKITKKKKPKPSKDDNPVKDVEDNSTILKKLEDEDREMEREVPNKQRKSKEPENQEDGGEDRAARVKTEAERRYEEQRRKRVRVKLACIFKAHILATDLTINLLLLEYHANNLLTLQLDDRLKREGVKTHKQRVEELNRYLSGLSEHHDMPRIGPG